MIWFLVGFLSAFIVSFVAMAGVWYVVIGRHRVRDQQQLERDFQRVRDAVLHAWRN